VEGGGEGKRVLGIDKKIAGHSPQVRRVKLEGKKSGKTWGVTCHSKKGEIGNIRVLLITNPPKIRGKGVEFKPKGKNKGKNEKSSYSWKKRE